MLQDRWDGDQAVALVARERCSYRLAATTFLQDLVEASARAGTELPSLRTFGCGGAPVPPALVDAAAARGITVLRLYGSTEVLVGTWNRADVPIARRRATDGQAMSHVELAVRDVVHGREVKNKEALANPEALDLFRNIPELQQ